MFNKESLRKVLSHFSFLPLLFFFIVMYIPWEIPLLGRFRGLDVPLSRRLKQLMILHTRYHHQSTEGEFVPTLL